MKNDDQENGVLTGPLILIVPASNLVAIMSLNWLDAPTKQLFPRKRTVELSDNSAENSERLRRVESLRRADFAGELLK
jgi:hypothetical protein